jgi:hypothetical protein
MVRLLSWAKAILANISKIAGPAPVSDLLPNL